MDDNKIVHHKSAHVACKEIIKPSLNTLRKSKGFPSVTSVWSNSIYSFNQNYLKNIPSVDNIVNKIIKSFFTINALANNPRGKKSRLVQRRYKKLSLNKILVSKSEIKHSNDKVFITVYLFNKKKRSLLLKLNNLYKRLSLKKITSVSGLVRGEALKNKKALALKGNTMKQLNGAKPLKSETLPFSAKNNTALVIRSKNNKGKISVIRDEALKNLRLASRITWKKIPLSYNKGLPSKNKYISWKKFINKGLSFGAEARNSDNRALYKNVVRNSLFFSHAYNISEKKYIMNILENIMTSNNKFTILKYKFKNIAAKNLSTVVRNNIKNPKLLSKIFLNKYAFITRESLLEKIQKNIFSYRGRPLFKFVLIKNRYYRYYKRNYNFKDLAHRFTSGGKGLDRLYFKNRLLNINPDKIRKSLMAAPIFKGPEAKANHENDKRANARFDDKNMFLNKILYYKRLNTITRYNMHKFITSLLSKGQEKKNLNLDNLVSGLTALPLNPEIPFKGKVLPFTLKSFFTHVNKYKLYNNSIKSSFAEALIKLNKARSSLSNLKENPKTTFLKAGEGASAFPSKGMPLKKVSLSAKSYLRKPNYSIFKLKSMHKLFTLYNNINLVNNGDKPSNRQSPKNSIDSTTMSHIYSKKILLNTYKLLKKSYLKFSVSPLKGGAEVNSYLPYYENIALSSKNSINNDRNLDYTAWDCEVKPMNEDKKSVNNRGKAQKKNVIFKFKKPFTKIRKISIPRKKSKSYINIKKTMNSIILINKLNRIDRFFNKYKNIFLAPAHAVEGELGSTVGVEQKNHNPGYASLVSAPLLQQNAVAKKILSLNLKNKVVVNSNYISDQIISTYKVNFINDLLEKELLYIYYLKLLTYNNAIFKNWFLYSLKNLISKIYNKKVIFNLINLKYIHLNSDILSQAVNIRLRNFKKNRVVKVLKKAIKLVPISKVNIYACDEHSSMYKYVHNYYNKFKDLKLDIFKELGLGASPFLAKAKKNLDNNYHRPLKIKRLNQIQANTINFIKYKSVFGVRLEAAGRLTKRSTASRAIFKFRYKGTLRNNTIINNSVSSVIIKNNRASNLQFTKIASKTRNGSFGLKGWINNN